MGRIESVMFAAIPLFAMSVVPVAMAIDGCAHAKTACAVIDAADTACETFVVKYKDESGQVQIEQVPASELAAAAMRVKAARASSMVDAGAGR